MPIDRREKGDAFARAFTLVEMLTAVSLLVLITLFLASISNQTVHIWTRGENGSQYRQHARTVLDFMGSELKAAAVPIGQANTLYTAAPYAPSLQFVIDPATLGGGQLNRDALFWQASVASDLSSGDLAEVGYFVQWNGTKANLCRFFVNPSDAANYLIYGTQSADAGWISPAVIAHVVKPDKADSYQGLFLENVIGLWVQAYQADGTALPAAFDSRVPYASADGASHPLPASVEVAIVLLDTTAAVRLTPQNVAAIRASYSVAVSAGTSQSVAADTANAFVQSLPPALAAEAYVSSIKVGLSNYR